jgi:hypothetical protein
MTVETREVKLWVFTGLVVAYVRQGLQHHWRLWGSIGDFLAAWLIHTFGVGILGAAAGAAIIYSHKFFLGYDKKEYNHVLDAGKAGHELYFTS